MIFSEPTAIGVAPARTRPSDPIAGGMDVIPLITTAEAEGAIEILYFCVGEGPGLGLTSSLLDDGVGLRPNALAMRAASPGFPKEDEAGLFGGDPASLTFSGESAEGFSDESTGAEGLGLAA